jgi:hypothetical protein
MIADVGKTEASLRRAAADCKIMRGGKAATPTQSATPRQALFRPAGAASAKARPQRTEGWRRKTKEQPRGQTRGGGLEKQEWQG